MGFEEIFLFLGILEDEGKGVFEFSFVDEYVSAFGALPIRPDGPEISAISRCNSSETFVFDIFGIKVSDSGIIKFKPLSFFDIDIGIIMASISRANMDNNSFESVFVVVFGVERRFRRIIFFIGSFSALNSFLSIGF